MKHLQRCLVSSDSIDNYDERKKFGPHTYFFEIHQRSSIRWTSESHIPFCIYEACFVGSDLYCVSWDHHSINRNITILTKFLSLAALEVVILTTPGATNHENVVKSTSPFQYDTGNGHDEFQHLPFLCTYSICTTTIKTFYRFVTQMLRVFQQSVDIFFVSLRQGCRSTTLQRMIWRA